MESYQYSGGDRLLYVDGAFGRRSYEYNGRGFLTATRLNGQLENTLALDLEERLLAVTPASGTPTTFNYNALGQRVSKQDNTGPYTYITDGASAGSPVLSDGRAFYTPGLSERRNGVSRFHHTDILGTLGVLLDAGQNGTDGRVFDAWGVNTGVGQWGTTPTPFEWGGAGGYQKDFSTGLVLMGNRYYDASIGRFISRDPIQSGSNWYAYADNNPVSNMDPLGLQADSILFSHPVGSNAGGNSGSSAGNTSFAGYGPRPIPITGTGGGSSGGGATTPAKPKQRKLAPHTSVDPAHKMTPFDRAVLAGIGGAVGLAILEEGGKGAAEAAAVGAAVGAVVRPGIDTPFFNGMDHIRDYHMGAPSLPNKTYFMPEYDDARVEGLIMETLAKGGMRTPYGPNGEIWMFKTFPTQIGVSDQVNGSRVPLRRLKVIIRNGFIYNAYPVL